MGLPHPCSHVPIGSHRPGSRARLTPSAARPQVVACVRWPVSRQAPDWSAVIRSWPPSSMP
jgi:hypothetical protein